MSDTIKTLCAQAIRLAMDNANTLEGRISALTKRYYSREFPTPLDAKLVAFVFDSRLTFIVALESAPTKVGKVGTTVTHHAVYVGSRELIYDVMLDFAPGVAVDRLLETAEAYYADYAVDELDDAEPVTYDAQTIAEIQSLAKEQFSQ